MVKKTKDDMFFNKESDKGRRITVVGHEIY